MAEDYPHALDVEIWDGQGRKVGLYHLRAPSAADFIAEANEVDGQFADAVANVTHTVRSAFLLKVELGAEFVSESGPAPSRAPAPRRAPQQPQRRPQSRQAAPAYDDAPDWPETPPGDDAGVYCDHGEMKYVPAGVGRNNKPYKAFYACQLDRNDPNRCRTRPA
ncbi:hypothetical protein [Nonomuraea sp. NPDC023979]|uniref:hypothetical protein n=1 Tax=Nonomuraea sp. NPDC023979 TaxID=3154796 RepID=UPI003402D36A